MTEEIHSVTVGGVTVSKDDQFHVEGDWTVFSGGRDQSLYVKVDELYETHTGYFAVLRSTGIGPDEVDMPVNDIVNGLGTSLLSRRTYDPSMNG